MEFRVLGPVEAYRDGVPLPRGSARERSVLATLLLNAERLTPADLLVGVLWDAPPASAKPQLHNIVSKLRGRLRAAGADLIATRPSGYQLRLHGHRLDVAEFRRLASQAGAAAQQGDHAQAALLFGEALAEWRGPAVADVTDGVVAAYRSGLEEERLAAAEAKLDADLALGRHADVLARVEPLLVDHPYAERLWARRLLALDGLGRREEAAAAYRAMWRRFVDELGVEPGAALVELGQRLRRGEPLIGAGPVLDDLPAPLRQVPPPPALTGRDALLDQVCQRVAEARVAVLVGPGGVGKSALAYAVARRLRAAYPRQLYADLRGSHPDPADPHQVAARFLRALGVPGDAVPDDPDELIAAYRSHLAELPTVLVLDDAADEAQARPLLPGDPAGAAVVTSRRQLAALVGAARFPVPALSVGDAVRLLVARAGADRLDPEAAATIVELCGGLPLAVCIAGARLRATSASVTEYAQRLADERRRLDELAAGDLDVRASIGLSYAALPEPARRLLRRLGLLATADWPRWVADALADEPGERWLEHLTDVHLVAPAGRDGAGQQRCRLHDLVADFARERAAVEEPVEATQAALGRVLDGWLALATEADRQTGHGTSPGAALTAQAPPESAAAIARTAPYDWFEAERASLVAAVAQACRLGRGEIAAGLALRTVGFLAVRGYDDDRHRVLRDAADGVRQHGPGRLLATLLTSLFEVLGQQDRRAELPGVAAEALTAARRAGDREAEARALHQAGRAARMQGRFAEARRWLAEALDLVRRPDVSRSSLAATLEALGNVHVEAGDPEPALPLFREGLALSRAEGRHRRTAQGLHSLGRALLQAGRPEAAAAAATEALEITRSIGDEVGTAYLEHLLAAAAIWRGAWREAEPLLERSLAANQERRNREGVAEVLASYGELALGEDQPERAVQPLRRALAVWRDIGSPLEVARTQARLALALAAVGDAPGARESREQRDTLLAELELGEAGLHLPPFLSGGRVSGPPGAVPT